MVLLYLHAEASLLEDGPDRTGSARFTTSVPAPLPSSAHDGFIPLPPRTSLHAVQERFNAARHPPRTGGLSAPRVPFAGLSPQARHIMNRRARTTAASSAVTAAANQAAANSRITHAPRTSNSDDEYKLI